MLVLGAANNAWEMLSSLQPLQLGNASAPAAGFGVGPFVADEPTSPATAGGGVQSNSPPTGPIGQASLSPDVLGFLIWNQSQQPGTTQQGPSGADTSATSGTNSSGGASADIGIAASAPLQSLLSLLGSAGDGMFGSSAPSATATNADGSTTTAITYADGSAVTLTTPPQASSANPSPTGPAAQPLLNSNNFLETLIQLQARLLAPTAAA